MEKPIFDPKNFTWEEWKSLISGIGGDMYGVLIAASRYKTWARKMGEASSYVGMWEKSRMKWHPGYREE